MKYTWLPYRLARCKKCHGQLRAVIAEHTAVVCDRCHLATIAPDSMLPHILELEAARKARNWAQVVRSVGG